MSKLAAVFAFAILSMAALSGCGEVKDISAVDPGTLEVNAHIDSDAGTVSGKGHADGFDFAIISATASDQQERAICETVVTRTDDPILMPVGTPLVLFVTSSGDYLLSTFDGNRPPIGTGNGSAADAGPSFSLSGTFSHIKTAP